MKPRGTHYEAAAQGITSSKSRKSHTGVNCTETDPLLQDRLKEGIMEELRVPTFEDSTLLERFCPSQEIGLASIWEALQTAADCARHKHPLTTLLPPDGLEDAYNQPIADIINSIGQAYHVLISAKSPYLPIQVYDRHTRDGIDASVSLKPDLISLANANVANSIDGKYCWGEIGLVGEVKAKWQDLVAQAGTYGRAILNAHRARTFALVVAFNHVQKHAQFLFFHRGGLHSTPEFPITKKKGLEDFIHGVVVATALQLGNLNWTLMRLPKTPGPSKNQRPFPFEVVECMYRRVPMTGRCTAGWILQRRRNEKSPLAEVASLPPPAKLPPRKVESGQIRTRSQSKQQIKHTNPSTKPEPEMLPPSSHRKQSRASCDPIPSSKRQKPRSRSKAYSSRDATANVKSLENSAQHNAFTLWHEEVPLVWVGDDDLPDRVFVKDAWAPIDQATEPGVHERMCDEFGAAQMWQYQILDSNEFFYASPEDMRDWHVFIDKSTPTQFDRNKLVHLAMYFSTIGAPLHTACTPRELLVPVLHAMLAHYALFRKHNMVHRDISCNNIMRLSTSLVCKPPISPKSEELKQKLSSFSESEGLLIDADLTRNFSTDVIHGKEVSGTWPYISVRLHENAEEIQPIQIQHNPIDDLESSIWVILWECYTHALKLGKEYLSSTQQSVFFGLRHHKTEMMLKAKQKLVKDVSKAIPQCPPLNAFIESMNHPLAKIRRASIVENDVIEAVYQIYFLAFLRCLESGHASLTQTWNELFVTQQAAESVQQPVVLTLDMWRAEL